MEDLREDDTQLVRETAGEFVARWEAKAVEVLRDYEREARDNGDTLSGDAWRDIADAAVVLLNERTASGV